MITNHWGKWVDSDIPTTGVFQTNNCEWIYDAAIYHGIDLTWEDHLKDCKNEDHEYCYQPDFSDYLIGYRKDPESGLFEPDPDKEYSAIVRGDSNVTQVTASKWVIRCALCSPCYPGQGDGDSKGDYLAFAIPPDVVGDTNPKLKRRIFQLTKDWTCSSCNPEEKGGEVDGSIQENSQIRENP